MNDIILIGLNHNTAPVELRECVSFSDSDNDEALKTLKDLPEIDEVVLFSTCNRVEILSTTKDKPGAIESIIKFISEYHRVDINSLRDHLYIYKGDEAVRHLLRVASSLDSMIIGEPQVFGQVKEAYNAALSKNSSGLILNRLLQYAFSVAKRVRNETGIGDGAVSISYAAVELGSKIFHELEGKHVLLIGAGEMAEIAIEHLISHKVGSIFVANRTFDRGVDLAKKFNGTAIRFEEIIDYIEKTDVVISSTGSPDFVVTREQVKGAMKIRRNRPIFFIDIAVPRDIDPDINQLSNVYVYDIDDLKDTINENLEDRKKESIKGERIVDEAVIQFNEWRESLDIKPTLLALRKKIQSIAENEIEKTLKSLDNLSKEDYESINRMMDSFINKILHDPTLFLKSNEFKSNKSLTIDFIQKIFNLGKLK